MYYGRTRPQAEREAEEVPREHEPLVQADVEPGAEVPPRLVTTEVSSIGNALNDGRMTPSSTFTSLLREELLGAIRSTPSLFFHENVSEPEDVPHVAFFPPPPRRSTPHPSHNTVSDAPLLPPPSINPDQGRPTSQFTSASSKSMIPSIAYPDSPVSDVDETAALMTASRVRVGSSEVAPQSGGLGMRIARLGRLSWFDRTPPDDIPQDRRSASGGRNSRASSRRHEMMQRSHTSLAVTQGNRFSLSATTASSGPSIYYDANSRPRSQVSAGGVGLDQWGYAVPDILDMPVPPSAAATFSSSGSRPAHLRHPPGLTGEKVESLDDAPPAAEGKWGSVKSASSTKSIFNLSRNSGQPSPEASGSGVRSITSQFSSEGTSLTETVPMMIEEEGVRLVGSSRRRADTYTSGTETIVTDGETGAVMHFPTKVWNAEEGEGEWPDDAWTEFPSPGQAKWWGPPKSLERYQAQTGDPGTISL